MLIMYLPSEIDILFVQTRMMQLMARFILNRPHSNVIEILTTTGYGTNKIFSFTQLTADMVMVAVG